MSTESNKDLVRRFIEDVVNTGDVANLEQYISRDYKEPADPTGRSDGVEGMKRHIVGVRTTYPDLHVTVEQQIAEGDWVATRVTARGTHLGEWIGIKPTGRKVEMVGVNLDRIEDGKIVEHGGAADLLGPFLEIGAVRIAGDED